jgi:transcriptional regulator with XRE-family HTH domain
MTGQELRAARLRVGLTQSEVATLMGIAQPHISNHERGEETPGAGMLARYRVVYRLTELRSSHARADR